MVPRMEVVKRGWLDGGLAADAACRGGEIIAGGADAAALRSL